MKESNKTYLVVKAKFNGNESVVKRIPNQVLEMYKDKNIAIEKAKQELINYLTGIWHNFFWSTPTKNKEEAIQEFELFKKMPSRSCYASFPELKKHEVPECECDDTQCSSYGKTVLIGYIAVGVAVLKKPLVENADDIKFEIKLKDEK